MAGVIYEPLRIARQVGDALDWLDVPWHLGGSLASSLHGVPRSTDDIDLVADLKPAAVRPLVDALGAEFFIDADMIQDAIRRVASFNLLHLATMTKVDVFILKRSAHARAELARCRVVDLGGGLSLPVTSAEDIILEKLIWYEKGGRVSERQLRDVMGVLEVSGASLDWAYLERAAAALGVEALWEEVRGRAL